MTDFAMQVWNESQRLSPRAKSLWRNETDREDGVSETVLRAISKKHLFSGGNLAAWMNIIMGNIRRDQTSNGYAKGTIVDEPRMVYAGGYDYAYHIPNLDNPEAILIAVEDYGGKVDKLRLLAGEGRERGEFGPFACSHCGNPFFGDRDQRRRVKRGLPIMCSIKCRNRSASNSRCAPPPLSSQVECVQ